MKKIINVTIEIETEANDLSILQAIRKGIYWGLDVKMVAEPKKVTAVEFTGIHPISTATKIPL